MNSGRQLEILVLRCQIGDTDAFEELFKQYQPRLRYYLRRMDKTERNIDDTLQETWLAVLRRISKLKDPKAFTSWLYRIARNKLYGRLRKKQQFVQLSEKELPLEINGDEPGFSADLAGQIHKALDRIQPQHREVLTLCFLENLPYQQIAEIVGCGLGTVKSRIYYAKQSLREEMETPNG